MEIFLPRIKSCASILLRQNTENIDAASVAAGDCYSVIERDDSPRLFARSFVGNNALYNL